MVKKLDKNKKNLFIEIDKALAESVGITQKTDLEILAVNNVLLIRPKNKMLKIKKGKNESREVTNKLMDKYELVLKKLAKT